MNIEERLSYIEEQQVIIKARLSELEAWRDKWDDVIKLIAERIEEAKKHNASIVLREVIDPYAETTTVEQLLHLLESECPVTTVIDALSKKKLTEEENKRLASNLRYIIHRTCTCYGNIEFGAINEKATQEQETLVQDVQAAQNGVGQPMEAQRTGCTETL